MIIQVLHCPYCQGTDIVRHGKSPEGKQRYRCRECREGRGRTFLLDYSYAGQSPEVKEQIIDMAMNASGIRDTARVLKISPTTVINELKKRFCQMEPPFVLKETRGKFLRKRTCTPSGESCRAAAVESRASGSGNLSG